MATFASERLPNAARQHVFRWTIVTVVVGLAAPSVARAGPEVQGALLSGARPAAACRAPGASTVTASGARSLVAVYAACFRAGNVGGIVALLTSDVVSLSEGKIAARGRAQERRLYRSEIARVTNQTFRLAGIGVRRTGASVRVSARYRLLKAPGKPLLHGRLTFTVVVDAARLAISRVDQRGR